MTGYDSSRRFTVGDASACVVASKHIKMANRREITAGGSTRRAASRQAAWRGPGPANEAGLQREAIREAGKRGITPLGFVNTRRHPETAALLRKHGVKPGEEL